MREAHIKEAHNKFYDNFGSRANSESPPPSTFSGGSDPGRILDVVQEQASWIRATSLENKQLRRDMGLASDIDEASIRTPSMAEGPGSGEDEEEDPKLRHIKIRLALQEVQLKQLHDAKQVMEWHLHHAQHDLSQDRVDHIAKSLRG